MERRAQRREPPSSARWPSASRLTRARAQAGEADVQQKRAALEQAQRNLGYTKILAPVNGQVRKK